MKSKLFTLIVGLGISLAAYAEPSSGVFLGSKDLTFTREIWNPSENRITFGDINADKYYADFTFQTQNAIHVLMRPGTTYAFGCDSGRIIKKQYLIELDVSGREMQPQHLDTGEFTAKENTNYLVRVTFENVKICSGYGTSLIALLK